jgi:hypothetical protein
MHLFGSHLIKKYFDDFRTPNDIDWVTNDESEMKKSIVGKEEYYYMPFSPDREMTVDEIYTLKVSHAIYDIHWKKTMSDIRFLQIKGCKVIPEFLKTLREYWVTIHGDQKRTEFEVKPGKFFEDKVRRKVNHDDMHMLLNPSPTYKKIINGDDVMPIPEKFLSLSEIDKTELMFEEAFVIAIERFPNSPDRVAYQFAQQALVTRLHPVWLADYVIQNWNEKYWMPTKSSFYKKYTTIKNK